MDEELRAAVDILIEQKAQHDISSDEARRANILRMILEKGMTLAIIGIAIGIGGALALTRVLRNMLFEIKPTDPVTFIALALLLMIAAFAACYIPARQATKSDPITALRNE